MSAQPKISSHIGSKLYRLYRWASGVAGATALTYVALLYFPQPLFGYTAEYNGYKVHSRTPVGPEMERVLDMVDGRLQSSPINDPSVKREVYLTGGFGMYALLSHKAYRGFGNSVPFINNIFINKSDAAADLVFMDREKNNSRSLSGVIAHEVTHLLIRNRYGTLPATLMPTWKVEGYCEYIAGDSTIPLDEGVRLWRENPTDDTGYRYTKYHAMVKHLLEKEGIAVDDLFNNKLDETDVEFRTLAGL